MLDWLEFYQNIPRYLDPTAFSLGRVNVHWYAIFYLLGVGSVYLLCRNFLRKRTNCAGKITEELLDDLFLYTTISTLVFARLGYVLLYDISFFRYNPLQIVWPLDYEGNWTGISGMSFHGGLIGFLLALYFLSRKYGVNFLSLSDFLAPAVPAGIFFGRLGNFFNGELYGRETVLWWGMHFDSETQLRHPSQIYEALGEGLLLFFLLNRLKNKFSCGSGILSAFFLIGYGLIRFVIEFFRQPDPQIGLFWNFLTLGQLLSSFMIIAGGLLWFRKHKNKQVDL